MAKATVAFFNRKKLNSRSWLKNVKLKLHFKAIAIISQYTN